MRCTTLRPRIRQTPALRPAITAWHLTHTAAFLLRARIGHIVTRWQQRQQKGQGTVWTTVACRSLIARPVDQFRSVDAANASLITLSATLDAAKVRHVVVATPPELARVVVSDLAAALQALEQSPDAWYQHRDGRIQPITPTTSPATDGALVFQAWATHAGQYLAGADIGIRLVLKDATPQPATTVSFPIDAVITWVDGSDPKWQARKRARRAEVTEDLHETADNDARYESMDELKYCLRSIEMYAPWIRNIFLVTDQQVPTWLDPEDPRVTVVDHTEIFDDPNDLPTFNSHAIEARLHHIPGLADHWLYFNDDVFLARALPPSLFFSLSGRPKVFLAPDTIDDGFRMATDSPVVAAAKNNRDLLRHLSEYTLRHRLKHVPHPQLRTLTEELEGLSPTVYNATVSSPFRSPEDLSITSSLAPHFGLKTGRFDAVPIQHFYADTASNELRWRLPTLRETRDADVICLNAEYSKARRTERLQAVLTQIYPTGQSTTRKKTQPPDP